ncbi:hypothetical protein JQM60_02155 [Butyricicoccus pullicaecorum]|nr:hypothetical protein [Butyricicoccus pullicaecorum]
MHELTPQRDAVRVILRIFPALADRKRHLRPDIFDGLPLLPGDLLDDPLGLLPLLRRQFFHGYPPPFSLY